MKLFAPRLNLSLYSLALLVSLSATAQATLKELFEHPINEIKGLEGEVKPELSTLRQTLGGWITKIESDLKRLSEFKAKAEPYIAELELLLQTYGDATGATIAANIAQGDSAATALLNATSQATSGDLLKLVEEEGSKIIGTKAANEIKNTTHMIDLVSSTLHSRDFHFSIDF